MEKEVTPACLSELEQACAELEDKCDKVVGVTPLEWYMRQHGLCYLELVDGVPCCTDGTEKHPLSFLANPTSECSKCVSSFILSNLKGLEDNEG